MVKLSLALSAILAGSASGFSLDMKAREFHLHLLHSFSLYLLLLPSPTQLHLQPPATIQREPTPVATYSKKLLDWPPPLLFLPQLMPMLFLTSIIPLRLLNRTLMLLRWRFIMISIMVSILLLWRTGLSFVQKLRLLTRLQFLFVSVFIYIMQPLMVSYWFRILFLYKHLQLTTLQIIVANINKATEGKPEVDILELQLNALEAGPAVRNNGGGHYNHAVSILVTVLMLLYICAVLGRTWNVLSTHYC